MDQQAKNLLVAVLRALADRTAFASEADRSEHREAIDALADRLTVDAGSVRDHLSADEPVPAEPPTPDAHNPYE